jgi:ketosteroid isomerase-like protein
VSQLLKAIEQAYDAMNARDHARVSELLHPDAEWIPDSRVGESAIRGRDNILRFLTDRTEMFGDLHSEIERCWELEDQVLVFLRVTGRGQASGAGFDIRIAHLWTVRDGLAIRGEGFGDRGEALKAAGIDEQR